MAYRILLPQPIMESGRKYLEEKGYEIIDGEGFTEDDIIRQILHIFLLNNRVVGQ